MKWKVRTIVLLALFLGFISYKQEIEEESNKLGFISCKQEMKEESNKCLYTIRHYSGCCEAVYETNYIQRMYFDTDRVDFITSNGKRMTLYGTIAIEEN